MLRSKLGFIAAGTLLVSVAAVPALAEEVKTEAVITAVDGNTITARSTAGPLTVVLTDSRKSPRRAASPKKIRATPKA